MQQSIKTGLSFGLTSGIITTLGLMVGLSSGTHSTMVVIGGILTIAIADAMSDALGIHISEESRNDKNSKEIWASTIITFLAKFIFALTFVVQVLLFELPTAITVSIVWGLSILCFFSYYIAKEREVEKWKVIGEHLFITLAVIVITHFTGTLINSIYK
jgi:VIT1/CCC1 family predicted Fe2+/Mn2+ transporter